MSRASISELSSAPMKRSPPHAVGCTVRFILTMLVCVAAIATGSVQAAAQATGGSPVAIGVTSGAPGEAMIRVAKAELARGVRETPLGSNRSPDITRYRTAVRGAQAGSPWCAYFVSWLAYQAGSPLGSAGRGIGSVRDLRLWGQKHALLFRRDPQAGDIALWGDDHTGLVIARRGRQVISIEGNSSDRVAQRTYAAASVPLTLRLRPDATPLPVTETGGAGVNARANG